MKPYQKLMVEIGKALYSRGFLPIDSRNMNRLMSSIGATDEGRPIISGERVYNLGLEGKRSNIFVFTRFDPLKESVNVLMASPRADINAPAMDSDELCMKEEIRRINENEIGNIAERVADRAASEARTKDAYEYRMHCHVHTGQFFDGSQYFDDGISNIADIVRRAMLSQADVLVLTTHNSMDLDKFMVLNDVCRLLGITAIMGTELTVPLVRKHVNGPHHLLFLGNKEAAEELFGRVLSQRDPSLQMQSYWRSSDGNMLIDDIYRELSDLRQCGVLAIGAAHPFNFISSALPIKAVGLLSAVDMGQLSLNEAIARMKLLDFVEVWNRSISPDVMSFKNKNLYKWISGLVRSNILNNDTIVGSDIMRDQYSPAQIMSANVCNLALGIWLESRGLTQQTFGSDDHCTPPLDGRYLPGGYFASGFSFFRSDRRLSAGEIVRRISQGSLGLSAHVYAAGTDKGLRIPESRAKVHPDLEAEWNKLKHRHFRDYVRVLMADAFSFLEKGESGMIRKMDK